MAITVLIADDSPFMLSMVSKALSNNSSFKVIGEAKTGIECISKIIQLNPKVVVLDIMLPDTSGLEIVYQIMRAKPTPVLLFSSLTEHQVKNDSRVFDYGIVDFITKPTKEIGLEPMQYLKKVLIPKLSILSKLRISKFQKIINMTNNDFASNQDVIDYTPKPVAVSDESMKRSISPPQKIVVIGASTGGPQMIAQLIQELPVTFPPVLIVQHIPSGFIENFVARVNKLAKINVVTGADGMVISSGTVYLAPGGFHMDVIKIGSELQIRLDDGPYVNFVRPSVDITLKAVSRIFKRNLVTVILTGMGRDGTDGCREVKQNGGKILALNEEDSVVFGMNKSVIDAGFADKVLPLDEITNATKSALGLQ